MDIIVASNNKGKIREIKAIFGAKHNISSIGEININIEIEETGTTFLENALLKAKAIYDLTKTPVLSDDSGLMVEALDGQPGVYSARYSGKTENTDFFNNQLLLKNLEGVDNRRAKFISVIVLYYDEDKYIFSEGTTDGEILFEPIGNEGFGYDPLFYSFELQKTFAEATLQEKNSVSHRAKALEKLFKMLVTAR